MLNILIVDDEKPARNRLRRMLGNLETEVDFKIVTEAENGEEALSCLQEHPEINFIFLDIRMPALDGFEVIERMGPENRPLVVFTTAYDAYALKAFDAHALDYLMKPVNKDRLLEAVNRGHHLLTRPEPRSENEAKMSRLLDWVEQQAADNSKSDEKPPAEFIKQLSVPYRDRILIIPVGQLISVEIVEGITRLYVLEDVHTGPRPAIRQHIVNYTLEQLEHHLDPNNFLRVHRSVIVQISKIKEMIPWFSGRYKLILEGHHEVIASRERSKVLKGRIMI